jgi:outer membrane protein assembly factor BamB
LGWLSLLACLLLAAGCAGVSNPEGWAGPQILDGTLYASIDKGRMAALDPVAESGADCENAEDDDLDGGVNEGCDRAGQKAESGDDCRNGENDDGLGSNPDDDVVNDGCPPVYRLWVFPPDTDEGNRRDLEGIYGAPLLNGDILYFGAYDGNVYALDAPSGILLWQFETDDAIIGSLALKDVTLYAGSTDGRLYAIDTAACVASCPRSAALTFDTGSSIWASPVVFGDVVYVPDMDGRLHALEARTLDPVAGFSFQTNAGLLMEPTLANEDTLLVGGIDSELYELDAATGRQRWSKPFEGGNWFWGKPLVDGDTVYIADLGGNVHAVNLTDGTPKWGPFQAEASIRSAPVLAGDTLVAVDRHGNAYGINPDDGSPKWGPTVLGKTVLSDPFLLQAAATATPATDVQGVAELLIVAQGGDLCRIDPADGSPSGPALCTKVPS